MGGKGRWAKKIVAAIEPWIVSGIPTIEVCSGACNVTEHLPKPIVAYDLNPALISMWQAAQVGWKPPLRHEITEELHAKYKLNPIDSSDPLTAFLLFGCSFRGVWCGGFARDVLRKNGRIEDYISESSRAFLRKSNALSINVDFVLGSYADINPIRTQVVYADPPYISRCDQGISGHRSLLPKFDHVDFWTHARQWSEIGARVFVSEETAPEDWIRYRSWSVGRSLGNWSKIDRNGSSKLESIWVHRDSEMTTKIRCYKKQ